MNLTTFPDGTTVATIESDTHISRWVIENQRLDHDQNMLPLLAPYLRGTVIDVGAFIGDHTIYYARHAATVLAFEPNPEAFHCLQHNMAEFDNVRCYPYGLGAVIETAGIIENANAGMAVLGPGKDITVVALDAMEIPSVSFMKIDAEGWECDVLEGARNTIARCRPVMLIEINESALRGYGSSPNELIVKIEAMRYTLRNIYEDQPMRGPQYDVLCLPMT